MDNTQMGAPTAAAGFSVWFLVLISQINILFLPPWFDNIIPWVWWWRGCCSSKPHRRFCIRYHNYDFEEYNYGLHGWWKHRSCAWVHHKVWQCTANQFESTYMTPILSEVQIPLQGVQYSISWAELRAINKVSRFWTNLSNSVSRSTRVQMLTA